jgi:molecular chaperone DnaK
LDVTPLSLGIETMGGVFTKLINANTTIPTKQSQVFSTAADNQPTVEIHVLQGERAMARDNRSIGKFMLDGLPPAMRGVPQIEVTFDIDANGIINVSAKDKATDKQQSIRIESSSGLSKEEIERMKQEAEMNADADKKVKEDVETINQADSTIFNIEKSMKEMDEKMTEEEKTKISSELEELKTAYESKDVETIKEKMEQVNTSFQGVSMRLYMENQQTPPTGETTESTEDREVTDVDFEEVEAK